MMDDIQQPSHNMNEEEEKKNIKKSDREESHERNDRFNMLKVTINSLSYDKLKEIVKRVPESANTLLNVRKKISFDGIKESGDKIVGHTIDNAQKGYNFIKNTINHILDD